MGDIYASAIRPVSAAHRYGSVGCGQRAWLGAPDQHHVDIPASGRTLPDTVLAALEARCSLCDGTRVGL